jgi:methylated-DNA-[protein]-cysteine S-methyltransferase
MVQGLYIFDTAIGPCGLAWSERGVTGAALPESTAEVTLARLKRRRPDAELRDPPAFILDAAATIQALVRGEPVDLRSIPLDQDGYPELERQVWDITHAIPFGETLTYGDIARRLGDVGLSRAVGQALGANPIPIIVPCHRVVAADGKTGGFSAPGGVSTKLQLLNIERAATSPEPMLFGDLPLAVKAR